MCMMAAAVLPMMLGVAQGVMQYQAQQEQYEYEKARKAQNDRNALIATRDRYDALNIQATQQFYKASAEDREAQRQGLAARGRERAAQAEAGVGGFSADAVLADLYREEGEFRTGLQTSLDWQLDAIEAEGKSAKATGMNQINSVPQPIKPSFAAAGIRILGSVFNNMPQMG